MEKGPEFFLCFLGLLSSDFNWLARAWPMWIGKTFVVKQFLYVGTMSRKEVKYLQIWGGAGRGGVSVVPQCFSSSSTCSHQVRNRMCVCISIFAVGYKVKVINHPWLFVLEHLWVKMFQMHWTVIGEEVKALQVCCAECDTRISGLISALGKMEVLDCFRWVWPKRQGERMLTAWRLPPRELHELHHI